jgi:hypothetical protein
MISVTKNKDEIIVREIPVAQWINAVIVGAVLFLVVFFMLSSTTSFFNLAWSLGAFVAVAGFFLYLLDNPSITTKINKQGETVSVRKQSLIKYTFNVYSFKEIADLIYVYELGAMPKIYQILLPLNNGREIEISTQIKMNAREYFEAADLMNSYIFDTSKQISAKAAAWDLKKTDD